MSSKTRVKKGRRTMRKKVSKNDYVHKVARQEARKVVKREIETKMYDHEFVGLTIDYSASTTVKSLTTGMVQGTDDSEYLGRKIKPSYIQIRGIIARSDSTNVIRMVVLQDKVSGVALTGATIWQSVGNQRAPFSPFERQYNDTFKVLADRTFNFSDKIDGQQLTRIFKIKIPGSIMRPITFRDTIGTLESGGLYIAFISDDGGFVLPSVDFKWRISYKDA